MDAQVPKYRVSTVEPASKDDVFASFQNVLLQPFSAEHDVWHCADGSALVFRPSAMSGTFYIEFQCQFRAEAEGAVNYGILPRVIEFCANHGGKLKVVRNGAVLPASGGVYSDVFYSRADRVVAHVASHPKDVQAKKRFGSSTPSNMAVLPDAAASASPDQRPGSPRRKPPR